MSPRPREDARSEAAMMGHPRGGRDRSDRVRLAGRGLGLGLWLRRGGDSAAQVIEVYGRVGWIAVAAGAVLVLTPPFVMQNVIREKTT